MQIFLKFHGGGGRSFKIRQLLKRNEIFLRRQIMKNKKKSPKAKIISIFLTFSMMTPNLTKAVDNDVLITVDELLETEDVNEENIVNETKTILEQSLTEREKRIKALAEITPEILENVSFYDYGIIYNLKNEMDSLKREEDEGEIQNSIQDFYININEKSFYLLRESITEIENNMNGTEYCYYELETDSYDYKHSLFYHDYEIAMNYVSLLSKQSYNLPAVENMRFKLENLKERSFSMVPKTVELYTGKITEENFYLKMNQNCNDLISCIQTMKGALTECNEMLQRMTEIETKKTNDINEEADILKLCEEEKDLITELKRISQVTAFNNYTGLLGQTIYVSTPFDDVIEKFLLVEINHNFYDIFSALDIVIESNDYIENLNKVNETINSVACVRSWLGAKQNALNHLAFVFNACNENEIPVTFNTDFNNEYHFPEIRKNNVFSDTERNLCDGVKMIQFFEATLQQFYSILYRMDELHLQYINGTNNEQDRYEIKVEWDELLETIEYISNILCYDDFHFLKTEGIVFIPVSQPDSCHNVIEIKQLEGLNDKINFLKNMKIDSEHASDEIMHFINMISTYRNYLGANQNAFEHMISLVGKSHNMFLNEFAYDYLDSEHKFVNLYDAVKEEYNLTEDRKKYLLNQIIEIENKEFDETGYWKDISEIQDKINITKEGLQNDTLTEEDKKELEKEMKALELEKQKILDSLEKNKVLFENRKELDKNSCIMEYDTLDRFYNYWIDLMLKREDVSIYSVPVCASNPSVFNITVPKKIILGKEGANYSVTVDGDVSSNLSVSIQPFSNEVPETATDSCHFIMSEVSDANIRKSDLIANVKQDKISWNSKEIEDEISTTGTVSCEGLSAGRWSGVFSFYIETNSVLKGSQPKENYEVHIWRDFDGKILDVKVSEKEQIFTFDGEIPVINGLTFYEWSYEKKENMNIYQAQYVDADGNIVSSKEKYDIFEGYLNLNDIKTKQEFFESTKLSETYMIERKNTSTCITIPKNIVLNHEGIGTYEIDVENNFENISVEVKPFDENIQLKDISTDDINLQKENITANIIQEKTIWKVGDECSIGTVLAPELTAGLWRGYINFIITIRDEGVLDEKDTTSHFNHQYCNAIHNFCMLSKF